MNSLQIQPMHICCKHSWKVKGQGSPGCSHGAEYKIRADTVNTLYFLTDVSDDQNTQELRGSVDFKRAAASAVTNIRLSQGKKVGVSRC